MAVEPERILKLNDAATKPSRKYVLYWAQMNRRADSNHGLLHAIELGNALGLPVLYYEGLTCSYPYANDRLHTFILEGVPDTARRLEKAGIGYCFYLRETRSSRNDVLYELSKSAATVVTDDYPTFVARRHNQSVPDKLDIPFIAVDSSCVVPMRKIEKREFAAYTIRPKIHKLLPSFLQPAGALKVKRRFDDRIPEFHTKVTPDTIGRIVARCEIDHAVNPSLSYSGGSAAAQKHVEFFLAKNLRRYAKQRNEPGAHATSSLSPYLHFGNICAVDVALRTKAFAQEHKLVAAEFLEELIVRRELAFNYARFVEQPVSLENLPEWTQRSMRKHASDRRPVTFTREQLESAETYDELWNASQKEMLLRGKIHGYYRMYWGKKIIEWSAGYREALETMVYLHDRYALDGRDPNTYTNILWCFGLHDRAWAERPIFGNFRYMSLEGMKRKTHWQAYIEEIRLLEKTGKDPYRIA
jgi:deoxyribodipyrimidine photo-lyase